MAIVIPSKHIYRKNFDPVIDNNIDKIEAGVKNPTIINDTENVYNKTLMGDFISYSKQTAINVDSKISLSAYGYALNVAYIEVIPTYITYTFTIPKRISNMVIFRLLTGSDLNGDANIKYSFRGSINKGKANGKVTMTGGDGFGNVTYSDLKIETPSGITTESNTTYAITSNETELEQTSKFSYGVVNFNTKATFSLSNTSNILTADARDNGDSFEITLTILCGIKTNKVGGGAVSKNVPYTFSLSGEYEEHIPTQVDVSFYGDTIKLDLQDETITINPSGNRTFSFNGNELIQTTNTPNIENKYQGVIDKWKNGKQTATISCPIADYYDENSNKVIDTSVSGKMIFQEGDIVVPYTYTNKGDKPLSYNKNLSPKQFKVVGTKISKRQGGTQELTLQEV